MISLSHEVVRLQKKTPLVISRGARTSAVMAFVRLSSGGHAGWGEASEFSIGDHRETLADIERGLRRCARLLRAADPFAYDLADSRLRSAGIPSSVRSAITQALLDWVGKSVGQPVWRLLGTDPAQAPPTSVTIGIGTPDEACRRLADWKKTGRFQAWKIKLGSPAGIRADRRMFEAVRERLPANAHVSVDVNGGWRAADAVTMSRWLAGHGVDHIEQPLPRGREHQLPALHRKMALPVILDESCCSAADIPLLAKGCDGINIKLMKCGGPLEALRMIHVARAHGLRVMIGCYSNSTLANTAAAHLGGLVDYLDLDSHMNLLDDPFSGARLSRGRLVVPDEPGFGVSHEPTHQT